MVQIRSGPLVIFSAIVVPDRVQVQAGVFRLEMSSTNEMSPPAIGFGTDGVIATSLAAHGPDGMATRVTGSSACRPPCWPSCLCRPPRLASSEGPVDAGPLVLGLLPSDEVSATFAAASPPDPPPEPPSSFAMPTTSSSAMPSAIIRRTQ